MSFSLSHRDGKNSVGLPKYLSILQLTWFCDTRTVPRGTLHPEKTASRSLMRPTPTEMGLSLVDSLRAAFPRRKPRSSPCSASRPPGRHWDRTWSCSEGFRDRWYSRKAVV